MTKKQKELMELAKLVIERIDFVANKDAREALYFVFEEALYIAIEMLDEVSEEYGTPEKLYGSDIY